MCAEIPALATRTQVILVLHHNEADKPTNTGRLASLALTGSEWRVRGVKDAPMSSAGFVVPERRSLVLYPRDDARVLDAALVAEDPRPVTLIVPDANWNQAARIVRREAVLAALPRVVLARVAAAPLQVRQNSRADGVSTIEAIAHALAILGDAHATEPLLALHRMFVERTLAARGVL
ncbi:MAG: DTW domain-containing protein [Deltaproteobacteria bacterium]|nr:DTW domain-containing protein [Deltaproteobacteria bacterium]